MNNKKRFGVIKWDLIRIAGAINCKSDPGESFFIKEIF